MFRPLYQSGQCGNGCNHVASRQRPVIAVLVLAALRGKLKPFWLVVVWLCGVAGPNKSVKGTHRPVAVLKFCFYQGSAASLKLSERRAPYRNVRCQFS